MKAFLIISTLILFVIFWFLLDMNSLLEELEEEDFYE